MSLDKKGLLDWFRQATHQGLSRAGVVLSDIVGRRVYFTSPCVDLVTVARAGEILGGNPEVAAAVYFGVSGGITGHLAFLLELEGARKVTGLLLQEVETSERLTEDFDLDPLGKSVLGEVGNVIGSCLLNVLADHLEVKVRPTTPVVLVDLTAAVMNSLLVKVGQYADEALLIQTRFVQREMELQGLILLLPEPDSLLEIEARIKTLRSGDGVGRRGPSRGAGGSSIHFKSG